MATSIEAEIAALGRMTVTALRQRYVEVFGEPTRSFNKPHLVKRIAWRLQAQREGGLSERARRRAAELAQNADLRVTPPRPGSSVTEEGHVFIQPFQVSPDGRLPMPGTWLKREYKGRLIQVRVLPHGFEFEGEVYRSLTAIANKVTGSHWNGCLFFGLQGPTRKHEQEAAE